MRRVAWIVLLGITALMIAAPWVTAYSYEEMSREEPGASATKAHPMGTDQLGRDRLSRLVTGSQVSLLLAPTAALLSTILATLSAAVSVFYPRMFSRAFGIATDLFLCLPWMFLLIAARALLPLNAGPRASVSVTFFLLGILGWAGPARIVRARLQVLLQRDDRLTVLAAGITPSRAFLIHLLPNLRPVLTAQFWIALPVFILSEANLSVIGLGISEPLPSWGNLLREFENPAVVAQAPAVLAPLVLLICVIGSVQILLSSDSRGTS